MGGIGKNLGEFLWDSDIGYRDFCGSKLTKVWGPVPFEDLKLMTQQDLIEGLLFDDANWSDSEQLWEFEKGPFLMAEIWPTSLECVLTLLKYQADRIHGTGILTYIYHLKNKKQTSM